MCCFECCSGCYWVPGGKVVAIFLSVLGAAEKKTAMPSVKRTRRARELWIQACWGCAWCISWHSKLIASWIHSGRRLTGKSQDLCIRALVYSVSIGEVPFVVFYLSDLQCAKVPKWIHVHWRMAWSLSTWTRLAGPLILRCMGKVAQIATGFKRTLRYFIYDENVWACTVSDICLQFWCFSRSMDSPFSLPRSLILHVYVSYIVLSAALSLENLTFVASAPQQSVEILALQANHCASYDFLLTNLLRLCIQQSYLRECIVTYRD